MITIYGPISHRPRYVIGRPKHVRRAAVLSLLAVRWPERVIAAGVRAWVDVSPACPGVNRGEMPAQFSAVERALKAALREMVR